jgi:hypothetical protein
LVLRDYKTGASRRGIPWELTDEQVKEITSSPCYYTGFPPAMKKKALSGEEYVYNGIDRVDSSKGYTPDNCVPCCTDINFMKRNMTKEKFLALCALVSERFQNVQSDH